MSVISSPTTTLVKCGCCAWTPTHTQYGQISIFWLPLNSCTRIAEVFCALLKGTLAVIAAEVASPTPICFIDPANWEKIWIFRNSFSNLCCCLNIFPQYPRWALFIDLFLKCSVFFLNGNHQPSTTIMYPPTPPLLSLLIVFHPLLLSSPKHNANALQECMYSHKVSTFVSQILANKISHLTSSLYFLPEPTCDTVREGTGWSVSAKLKFPLAESNTHTLSITVVFTLLVRCACCLVVFSARWKRDLGANIRDFGKQRGACLRVPMHVSSFMWDHHPWVSFLK